MRDITLCHPRLQQLAAKWIDTCADRGIQVAISETLRTKEEQDALYAQGRTEPGAIVTNAKGSDYRSQHQWGIAFDFYLKMDVDGDGKTTDDSYNDKTGLFAKAANVAKELGLAWGGDWTSIVDKPHLYLPDWGSTPTQLIRNYGTPDKFMATWQKKKKSGWHQEDGGWRYYLGNTGEPIRNDWHQEDNGDWYWFDGAGRMISNAWKTGKDGRWYYLGQDGKMLKDTWLLLGQELFRLNPDGSMFEGQMVLQTDGRGALEIEK